ncbi:glycosyl transferase [Nonomuraea cavernae]|uniref:Glycosyl transferase n=1 Tax=Nonomuraea cavernae TaxID=2045107 RepID=A0A918DV09_9ACTN|nr:glycosyl transferase [Nonomuraea cavernae]
MLPCLNEAQTLPWVLERMPVGYRPIVVDNGSTDGSARIAESYGATVVRERRRGFGSACHAGLLAATAEVVCFMDPDASLDPRQLPRVADPVLAREYDLVLGRRRLRAPARPTSAESGGFASAAGSAGSAGSAKHVWPAHARLGNALVAWQLRRTSGTPVRDLGPMRACRRRALLMLGLADRRFGYPLEMVLRASTAGWRIMERDVDYLPRTNRAKVTGTVRGTLRTIADLRAVLAADQV